MIKIYENGAWSEISPKTWTASRNLFDKNNYDCRLIYADGTGKVVEPAKPPYGYCLTIPVMPSTTYTISKPASTRRTVLGYSTYPELGVVAEMRETDYTEVNNRQAVTFTTTSNTNYIMFFFYYNTTTEPSQATLKYFIDRTQLEYGSEMTPLIPYGEHAWIDVAVKQYDNGEWEHPIING